MSRLSSLQDESSMPSLVLSGLQSVYRLTARKHRQLRAECEQLITAIQADDAAQQAAIAAATPSSSSSSSPSFISDSDADKYFLPFKLACESDNAKMVATALNCIEKLIAYGYLDGASYADPEVYPVKKTEAEQKDSKEKEKGGGAEEKKAASTPAGAGAKADASSSPDTRRLIAVIIDTVHHCSFNKDREVQLQSLKAILTAVTSVSCQVHGQPLVTAAYSCWNIHLQAVDDIIKNTAKATLTQLFNLAFQRMESFAVQLRQLEQSAALSAAVAGDSDGVKGKKAGEAAEREGKAKAKEKEQEEQKERESAKVESESREKAQQREKERIEVEKKDEEKVHAEDDKEQPKEKPPIESDSEAPMEPPAVKVPSEDEEKATPAETAAASDSSVAAPPTPPADLLSPSSSLSPLSPSSSPSPPPSSGPERAPAGKYGYCVVCSKPANFFCKETRAPVCSMEHKLIHLQRGDKKSTIASDVQKKIAAKFQVLQTDAYLLLRALIRISKKPLPSPPDPSAVDSKLLSLELLLSIMKTPGPTFRSSPQFVQYVKVEVVDSILKNSDASIEALFSLSSTLFVYLVKHFKAHLHKIIGPVLDSIYIPYIANSNSSYDVKHASLLVLKQIAADAATIVELFLNYDCEISSLNTFQKIATTLEKTVQGSYFASSDALTELDESRLKMIGLEALVETMKSLVEWTRRGEEWEVKKVLQAAKREEEREAAEEAGAGSRASSPIAAKSPTASSTRFAANGAGRSPSPSTASPPNEDDDPRTAHHEDTYVAASSTSSTFSSQFHQLRQQKQKLDTGILRFNMKPKKGLQYLFEHGLLDNTPEAVAAFFHANGSLDKTQVGDFMGEDVEFNKRVLYAYVDQMDFRALAFDDGIRAFVSGFRLPGEAQKIDRMMEKFAAQYHLHNPGMFSSADTAYVLAYSVILLNSDAHNPQVKNRMTKDEFFRNNRGIDNGHDINPAFLSDIYDRIITHEIRMKDDPYRHLIKPSEEVGGQKRVNLFMKESQQMVKKTQDLIRAISVKHNSKGGGDRRTVDDHGGEEGEGASEAKGGKGGKKEDRPFYLAQDSDWQACGAMFEILWYPSLATFSVLLEENESEAMIGLCLEGYRLAIRISNALNMETSRLAFVTSLKKFTLLGSSKEMRTKNIHAVKMLLQIVNVEGNSLKESWGEVLTMVSEVERLHLIQTSNKPHADMFVGESQLKGATVAPSPAPSQVAVGRNREQVDSVNAGKLLIDVALIERVFIHSANLNGDAIVDFVTALVRVSEHELSSAQPRVFSLQKIVEITYYNMGRIRLVWSKIWLILSDFFIKAGCHSNLGVSLYAIDSLRQLAMKFLEKDELAAFQFQKQFFRPFETVMQQNASVEARELIIGCLQRMVIARKKNIRSGWRAVFVVLAIAAQQSHAPLIQSSADLLSSMMEQSFALITEIDCMDECVNCLVAFGSQSVYTEVSLQAIHYLTLCAAHMGAVPQSADGTRSAASTPRHRSGSISSASGAPLVAAPTSQLSVALSTEVDEQSSSSYPASAPVTPVNLSTTYPVLPSLTVANQAHLLKVWFLLLTGLSRLVNDSRAEVRHLSLTTLFAILNENGHVFAASTWRAIFHGVLLPIFDDIRQDSHDGRSSAEPPAQLSSASSSTSSSPSSSDAAHDDALQQWLQTTCLEALSSLIQLFTRFYSTTHFLLPDLVRLLSGCMQQENEVLAKLGVDCFGLLMKEGARYWSVGSTWIVLEAAMDLIKRTLPTALLSPRVRQLLGLPPVKTSTPSRTNPSHPPTADPTTDSDPPAKAAQNGVRGEEAKEAEASATPPRSLTVDSSDAQAQVGVAPSPLSETVRSRSTPSSSQSTPPNLAHFFSTPLIHTRCKVQLLLQQALFDAIQHAFPQRDGRVISVLASSQSHPKEGHFRHSSGGGEHEATTPSSRATSAAGEASSFTSATPPSALGHPTINTEASAESAGHRRPSSAAGWERYHRRDDPRIFGHLLPSHLLYCLSIFSLTLSFSHSFNADIALRKKLYAAGFIIEQTGRLPQLFELEAKVSHFAWACMFRMWKEGGTREALMSETDGSAEAGAVLEELEHLPPGREADVLSSPRVLQMVGQPASSSYSAAYASVVLLSYHRMSLLTTRVLTDYLTKTQAGQLVSLEHVDDVVVRMVDAYASLSLDLFECDLDVMLPLLGELCEWGSIHVRGAVRKWIQGKGMRMMRLARSLRQLAGRAGLQAEEEEGEEEEEEDGEEEDEEEAGASQQPAASGADAVSQKPAAPPAENGEAPKAAVSNQAESSPS